MVLIHAGSGHTSQNPVWGHRWNLLTPILSFTAWRSFCLHLRQCSVIWTEACADAGITNRVFDPSLLGSTGTLVCVLRSSIRGEVLYTRVRGMVAAPPLKRGFLRVYIILIAMIPYGSLSFHRGRKSVFTSIR